MERSAGKKNKTILAQRGEFRLWIIFVCFYLMIDLRALTFMIIIYIFNLQIVEFFLKNWKNLIGTLFGDMLLFLVFSWGH